MIDFMRLKWFYFLLSGLVIVPGVLSLIFFGLKPSIDFTGGTVWEIQLASNQSSVVSSDIKAVFERQGFSAEVQESGAQRFTIKTVNLDTAQRSILTSALKEKFGAFADLQFETLGPKFGQELLVKALLAVILATLLIFGYIAYRFKSVDFGIAAISAAVHDVLVVLGTFSLLGHFINVEVDTLFVTAVLTTLAFSIHDTVVVFDRIREIHGKVEGLSQEEIINQAIEETLVRSLNNSLTIIFTLTALFALGGEPIRWFVFALLLGMITGTYSSIFNAAPLLLVLKSLRGKALGNSKRESSQ